jgi:CheY-like chemotaxis protein
LMPEVLLIDDDEFMLSLMDSLLREAGFNVLKTADGPQGIEVYARRKPDIVVLDLGLPSMDGLQVLKRIRDMDPKAKVVVVTGYPSEPALEAARALGACDFLPKPFKTDKFVELIREVAAKRP